jgi:hypothetical protein
MSCMVTNSGMDTALEPHFTIMELTISYLHLLFYMQGLSHSEHMNRILLHFPMGLHHCVNATSHIQCTVIICIILNLSPCDGEGGFIPCDGTREAIRDARGTVVCVIDKCVGSLAWDLLIPARVVTCRH